jgi:hypothetical protein
MEVRMSRETDWQVFEKACDITASAVRGAMTGRDGQEAGFVGDVFRAVHTALREAADAMPTREQKAGFSSG